jgi:putative PEP-CTERM system TPR-repeat lipoprotein
MNKFIIPAVAAVVVAGAGGGLYAYTHRSTPTQNAQALAARGDVRGALIELRNAVRADPADAGAHMRLAQLQLQTGDAIAAEREIRAAQDLKLGEDVTAPLLAQALLAQQRFADVLSQIPATAEKPAVASQLLVLRSVAQIALKDFPAAQAGLTEAERLSPQLPDPVLMSARMSIAQNDLPAADAKLDRALAIDPKQIDALVLKGQVLAAKGDRAGAIGYLDKAVDLAPNALVARVDRANQLLQVGQDAKAREDVDAVLAKDPRNGAASYFDMILLVRASKFTEADKVLTKLEPVLTRFPRGLYFQAIVKANLGETESAADAATRYVARAPTDPDGVRLLARIELAAKRPDRAVAVLVNGVKAGVTDAETMDMLGRAYSLDGKPVQAADTLQKAANLAPENPAILTHLASSKMQLGDTAGATVDLQKSLDLAPKQANAGEALVAAALASGDADKAQAALDKLRQQAGDTEAVGVLAGLVKLARRDLDGARVQFTDTVQRFPQSSAASVSLAKVLLLEGKQAEGEAALRSVLARNPADPQALTTLVGMLVQTGHAGDAVTAVQAAHAASPGDLALTAGIADLQVRAKDPKAALATLNEAQAAASGVLPTQLLPAKARAQAADGDIEGAKATYRRYVAANPADLEALRTYVELLVNNNDVSAARQLLQDALKTSPGNLGMMEAAVLIEQKYAGINAAVAAAEELRRNPANMPAAGVLKGDAYMAAGRFSDAAAAFADEAKAAPSTALTLRSASALIAGGGQDQASQVLRTWLAQHPDDADVAQVLSGLDINAKRLADAETHLNVVLAKRPNNPVALNNLAWVYQQRGNKAAGNVAQRAYMLSPTAESADTLGWILTTQGDPKAGLPLLQQANTGRPADPTMRYHLAAALNATGQKADALKTLEPLPADAVFDDKAAAQKLLDQLRTQK